jgi:hypothetical protein
MAKSGWERIEQGRWYKVIDGHKYELILLVNPLPDGEEEVFAQMENNLLWWAYHFGGRAAPVPKVCLIRSPVFGLEKSKMTYHQLIRKYVGRVHRWANDHFATPMDLLSDALKVK